MPVDSDRQTAPRDDAQLGLLLLERARESARARQLSAWEFAVEIGVFHRAGLTSTDLRSLLVDGLIERRREVTRPTDSIRKFRGVGSLALDVADCFVLTDAGHERLVSAALETNRESTRDIIRVMFSGERARVDGKHPVLPPVPEWDVQRRVLLLDGEVVKRFTHSAPSQELILAAFQEEGWPSWIDDPLPIRGRANPKRRLRQTVQNMNRAQSPQGIRFTASCDGLAVSWQPLQSPLGSASNHERSTSEAH